VFDAKRLIGRKFDDQEVQADLKHFPFTVLNKSGKPYIRVEYRGEQKEFVSSIFVKTDLALLILVCKSVS
jgi:molecular chaperone DnaK (HSP70)